MKQNDRSEKIKSSFQGKQFKNTKLLMKFFLLFTILFFTIFALHGSEKKTVWNFYERYPRMQKLYPWGLYTVPVPLFIGGDDRFKMQHGLDLLAENGYNSIWLTSHPFTFVKPAASKDDTLFILPGFKTPMSKNPQLTEFAKHAFGKMYPSREMKTFYKMQQWVRFNSPLLKDFKNKRALEKKLKGVLNHAKRLGETYPDTILGAISDDEPRDHKKAKIAIDLIEKNTGLLATTCSPEMSRFWKLAPFMQIICGDWYLQKDYHRDSWAVVKRLREFNKRYPEKVFILMHLMTSFQNQDMVLSGLREAMISQTELRMQVWQAVGLGAKGVFSWSHGESPDWIGGCASSSPLNALSKPTNKLWAEMKNLSLSIVPVGPLLLSCQADTTVKLKVSCGNVRYPEFQGPAIDYGLLKDVRKQYDRYFLVPWSNDIDNKQSGSLVLPQKLLKGRKIYDMEALREIVLTKGQLDIKLPPGGGRIFLITSPKEYQQCRDAVLQGRIRHPRVLANLHMDRASVISGIDMSETKGLISQAKQAESARQWKKAVALYNDAIKSIGKAEKKIQDLVPAKQTLEQLAATLSQTDQLLSISFDTLGLNPSFPNPMPGPWTGCYKNKFVGKEMVTFFKLVKNYWTAYRQLYYTKSDKKVDLPDLYKHIQSLEFQAKENKHAIEGKIKSRLQKVRKPVKVAFITPNLNQVEDSILYTRLYKQTYVDWIAPNGSGKLVYKHTYADWLSSKKQDQHSKIAGKVFNPDDYDVVFIHQIESFRPLVKGKKVVPSKVLMPEILTKAMRNQMTKFVKNGGGLLLSGLAGLYTNILGVENVQANKIRENSYYYSGFVGGFVPGGGFEQHPVFKGLPKGGAFTNSNTPKHNAVTECAWNKSKPSGYVIANELDDVFGRIDNYAAVVEYHVGKGKIIVFGGKTLDFTPAVAFTLPPGKKQPWHLLANLIKLTVNTLEYLGSKKAFTPASSNKNTKKVEKVSLPLGGWHFKVGSETKGMQKGWNQPGLDTTGWKPIRVDSAWDRQGYEGGVESGWYRIRFTAANRPGKKTMLYFAGVDEEALVFINGKLVGKHKEGPSGWNKPFSIDITKILKDAPKKYLLTVQVTNSASAGGIWKPVLLMYK